jgi:hypothetical protein
MFGHFSRQHIPVMKTDIQNSMNFEIGNIHVLKKNTLQTFTLVCDFFLVGRAHSVIHFWASCSKLFLHCND